MSERDRSAKREVSEEPEEARPGRSGAAANEGDDGLAIARTSIGAIRRRFGDGTVSPAPGKRSLVQTRYAAESAGQASQPSNADRVEATAARGVQGAAEKLPHLDRIQASFGGHDIQDVKAQIGGPAATASEAIGAEAYATGEQIGFRGAPDLHTAAHESAHVVQQRAGVQRVHALGTPHADPLEAHADQVANAVVSGRSAEPLLDQVAGSPSASAAASQGSVQLKKKKQDTSFVGGKGEQATALASPADQKSGTWVRPAEGGYAERLQGATVQVADSMDTAALEIQPVQPALGQIEQHISIANAEARYYDSQRSWAYSDEVSHQKIWVDRREYAKGKAQEFQTDKDNEQANFQAYNTFVPIGNSVITQLARITAQQQMLGASDNNAMKAALLEGLDDAAVVGQRASDAYKKNKDDEDVSAPKALLSVDSSLGAVRSASLDLDTAFVDFQRVLLKEEIEKLDESGADARGRLKKINEVKSFLKGIGGAISNSQEDIAKAASKLTNAITDPVGTAVASAEKGMELLGDYLYYEEVQKLTAILDDINDRIKNKKLAQEFRELLSVRKTYRAALLKFAFAARNLQRALHDRRKSYMNLGVKLDRFSQNDAESRREGRAAGRGGDRYATMLALVVEIRQAVALSRFAKDGLPDLSGEQDGDPGPQPQGPDSKAPKWAAWANGVINRRNSYASFLLNPGHAAVKIPPDERYALEEVYRHLQRSDGTCQFVIDEFGDIDAKAGDLMVALGGMREV